MIDNRLHTPQGVKDYLPGEYIYKKETEKRIENVFSKYSYSPLSSPMVEFVEVFDGAGSINPKRMNIFIDRDGSIVSLRADMTPPIARIAATAYGNEDIPLRFYYIENAFRHNESYQGKLREFTQAGVELIGINSVEADAEVIAVAVNSLLETGLKSFRIDVGHVSFFNGIMEEAGFNEETKNKIQQCIIKKRFTEVEEIVEMADIPQGLKEFLSELPLYIGGFDVLKKVRGIVNNETAVEAIEELESIFELLKGYRLDEYVRFDFSVVGHLDYYTGIIFRGYAKGTGFSIISGGRYDRLVKNYGSDYPAVGFGIRVNDLISALSNQNVKYEVQRADTLLVYTKEGRRNALMVADELRSKGLGIENSLLGDNIEKNIEYAKKKNLGGILYFYDNDSVKAININDGSEKEMNISQLIKEEA